MRILAIGLFLLHASAAMSEDLDGCLGASILDEEDADAAAVTHLAGFDTVIDLHARLSRQSGLSPDEVPLHITAGSGSPRLRFSCGDELRMQLHMPAQAVVEIKSNRDSGGLRFVIGHELGHALMLRDSPALRRQLCAQDANVEVRQVELLADFASGYLATKDDLAKSGEGAPPARNPVVRTVANLADYEFSNEAHHGRISERVSAYGFGGASAVYGHPLDLKYLVDRLDHFTSLLFVPMQGRQPAEVDLKSNLQRLYPP